MPTEAVAFSGIPLELAESNARSGGDGDRTSGSVDHNATGLPRRNLIPSLLLRAIGFALLILMVGSGVTKVAAPAVEMANIALLSSRENEPFRAMVKIADAQGVAPAAKSAKPLPRPENMAALGLVKVSDSEAIKPLPAKTHPERAQDSVLDPAELWKSVAQGNVSAEISLATLYLDGSATVEQNCEQAHQLLIVASRTGSKVASDLLNGKYAARCR
jgi:hypothetical protein